MTNPNDTGAEPVNDLFAADPGNIWVPPEPPRVEFTVVLDRGRRALFSLPDDLTEAEAARITRIVAATPHPLTP